MNDWLHGILYGAIGVPIVALAATGWVPTFVELILWTIGGIGWVVAARTWTARPWRTVIIAGVASAFWAGGMQALLLAQLVANNPAWADLSVDAATRLQAFLTAFPIGIVWGLLFAGITWLVGYARARRRPALA